MGYPKRVHYSGLTFHIINRGNNRQAIFLEEEDYRRYLSVLYHYKRKFNFKIFAYCLMTNHVHLLIQVDKVNISKIMQAITIAHTKHYHFKYRSSGHVWQGRFRSPIVGGDGHLLTAMAYIEQNPLRARMVSRIEQYKWSSYLLNIREKESKIIDRKDNRVWMSLGKSQRERVEGYKKYLAERIENDKIKTIHKSTKGVSNYMSEKFERQMRTLLPRKRKRGRPRKTNYELSDCMS